MVLLGLWAVSDIRTGRIIRYPIGVGIMRFLKTLVSDGVGTTPKP